MKVEDFMNGSDVIPKLIYIRCFIILNSVGKARLVVDGKPLTDLEGGIGSKRGPPSFDNINRRIDTLINGSIDPVFWTIDLSSAYQSHPYLRPIDHVPANGPYQLIVTIIDGVEYAFTTMIFGLPDAAHHFNNCLADVFEQNDLDTNSLPYVDDILTVSHDIVSGGPLVIRLIDTMTENGYRVNFAKSHFAMDSITFLGRVLDKFGSRADNVKLIDLINTNDIKSKKGLGEFIGKLNWLQQHINIPLDTMTHLRKLYAQSTLSREEKKELNQFITSSIVPYLLNPIYLHYPKPDHTFQIHTDASINGMGAILFQVIGSQVHIVATFQNVFSSSQSKWSIYRKEVYTIFRSLLKWRPFFGNSEIVIKCDNEAAVAAIDNGNDSDDHFVSRWISFIREFSWQIHHVSGEHNSFADNLSRTNIQSSFKRQDIDLLIIPDQTPSSSHRVNSIIYNTAPSTTHLLSTPYLHYLFRYDPKTTINQPLIIPPNQFSHLYRTPTLPIITHRHPNIQTLPHQNILSQPLLMIKLSNSFFNLHLPTQKDRPLSSTPSVSHISLNATDTDLPSDESDHDELFSDSDSEDDGFGNLNNGAQTTRLVMGIEEKRFRQLLEAHRHTHQSAKLLAQQMIKDGRSYVGLRRDSETLVANCLKCLQSNHAKSFRHYPGLILANGPGDIWMCDLAKLPPADDGSNYILIVVDKASGYIMHRNLFSKSADEIALNLVNLCCLHGCPTTIQSDNGSEFNNSTLREVVRIIRSEYRFSAEYNPRTNGTVEKAVGQFKMLLTKMISEDIAKNDGNVGRWHHFTHYIQFALNSRSANGTLWSPFEMMFGRRPRGLTSHDFANSIGGEEFDPQIWIDHINTYIPLMVNEMNKLRTKSWDIAAKNLRNSKLLQSERIPVGTNVMVKNVDTVKKNLSFNWFGPYRIAGHDGEFNYILEIPNRHGDPQRFERRFTRDMLKPAGKFIYCDLHEPIAEILQHKYHHPSKSHSLFVRYLNGHRENEWVSWKDLPPPLKPPIKALTKGKNLSTLSSRLPYTISQDVLETTYGNIDSFSIY